MVVKELTGSCAKPDANEFDTSWKCVYGYTYILFILGAYKKYVLQQGDI